MLCNSACRFFWSASIPLRNEHVLGSLQIYCRASRLPTPFELQFIERVTHLAALAIQRHNNEEGYEKFSRDWTTARRNLNERIRRQLWFQPKLLIPGQELEARYRHTGDRHSHRKLSCITPAISVVPACLASCARLPLPVRDLTLVQRTRMIRRLARRTPTLCATNAGQTPHDQKDSRIRSDPADLGENLDTCQGSVAQSVADDCDLR